MSNIFKRMRTNEKHRRLRELCEQYRITPEIAEDVYSSRGEKEEVLRQAGYPVLYGRGGSRIEVLDANDARLGQAFRRIYEQAYKGVVKSPVQHPATRESPQERVSPEEARRLFAEMREAIKQRPNT
jgi:hypothetical protein